MEFNAFRLLSLGFLPIRVVSLLRRCCARVWNRRLHSPQAIRITGLCNETAATHCKDLALPDIPYATFMDIPDADISIGLELRKFMKANVSKSIASGGVYTSVSKRFYSLLATLTVVCLAGVSLQAQTAHAGATITINNSSFLIPYGVAVDGSGNVFVADLLNKVREIVAVGGVVSSGSTVTPIASSFNNFQVPFDVAVDRRGDVFVADESSNAVYEILAMGGVVSSSSTVITVGSGFNSPHGVAVDGSGNVFVGDTLNSAVKEIVADSSGMVSTTSVVNTIGSASSIPKVWLWTGAGTSLSQTLARSQTLAGARCMRLWRRAVRSRTYRW